MLPLKAAKAKLAKKQNLLEKAKEELRKAEALVVKAEQEVKFAEQEVKLSEQECETAELKVGNGIKRNGNLTIQASNKFNVSCLLKTFLPSLYLERVLNHVPLRGHFRHLTRMIINLIHDKKIQKLCFLVCTLIPRIIFFLIFKIKEDRD